MQMQPNDVVFYELKGKSLEAAKTIRNNMDTQFTPAALALKNMKEGDELPAMARALTAAMPFLQGNELVSPDKSIAALAERDILMLAVAFKDKYKDLYGALGQNDPAIKVRHVIGMPPRAYAYKPEIYFHPADDERMIMIARTDHKGKVFVPEDAVKLTDEEARIMSEGLYAGGHSDPVPVIHTRAPYGVQTPADFDLTTSFHQKDSAPFDRPQMIELLRVMARVKDRMMVESNAIPGADDPDDVTLQCLIGRTDSGRPHMLVRAFNTKTQTALAIKDNHYFIPRPAGDFYEVVTKSHKPIQKTDTAGGGALQYFFDQIPDLSLEEAWKRCDEDDNQHFRSPPPLPMPLLHLNPQAPWPFPKSTP